VELLHHRFIHLGRLDRSQTLMLTAPERYRPARSDWLQAGLVAVVLMALYAATAPRTVSLEDDGLFILSSYFLGVEHPPGYPLFVMIGHLFSRLPFGSVAYRVHLTSAFFGGLAGAAAWLCARKLIPGRLPAYLVALGLGFSPVFWSQAIIAEVYTLNAFLFLVLVYLGLRACPPNAEPDPADRRVLPLMAFLFGLSLTDHWPLMLLVAPGFVILLWPRRMEVVKRFPLLLFLFLLGLLPYVWMVYRSVSGIPISFDGPLQSLQEIWYFISRAGYRDVDTSPASNWLDRIQFFRYFVSEALVQFAVAGTLIAGVGIWCQRRVLGNRVTWFLVAAFVGPSFLLLCLLGFEYDSVSKHVFQVYPLPSYAVLALWMGLGFAWLWRRFALGTVPAAGAAGVLLAIVLYLGSRSNLLEHYDWAARYAHAVLDTLPPNANLIVSGDLDLAPIGYFHIIEGERPDITMYQWKGLVLGNRLFHPLRTTEAQVQRKLKEFIDNAKDPVDMTLSAYGGYGKRDRWLYIQVDKSSKDPDHVIVDIPAEARRFFESSVLHTHDSNTWIAFHQDELRRRYAELLGRSLQRGQPLDARTKSDLEALTQDYYGAIGLAQGMLLNPHGYTLGQVIVLLGRARKLMPPDVPKAYLSKYFTVRGILRADQDDRRGAIEDLKTALSVWPSPDNSAAASLEEVYKDAGDEAALKALRERMEQLKKKL
jgi:Protein O-mannosyl-transferase TMEM260-like